MSRALLVVTIEGLGTNMLGCFGGPWAATPNLDHFAAHSHLFDQFWMESDQLNDLVEGLWRIRHAMEKKSTEAETAPLFSLPSRLAKSNLSSLLITDHSELLSCPLAEDFEEVFEISGEDHTEDSGESKESWEETHTAKFFEQALGLWTARPDTPLTWIHFRGWNSRWDAPMAIRESLIDEEDPSPIDSTDPPSISVDEKTDPDLLFSMAQAAAAQAIVLDHVWGWLMAAWEEHATESHRLILLGAGGYPLGEHDRVGSVEAMPYAERMHVPLILQSGQGTRLGKRESILCQPTNLGSSMVNWLDPNAALQTSQRWPSLEELIADSKSLSKDPLRVAISKTSRGLLLRTPAWAATWTNPLVTDCPVQDAEEANSRCKLYLHPEDRWQANDVSGRAHATAEAMKEYRDQWLAWVESNQTTTDCPPIPELLCEQPL